MRIIFLTCLLLLTVMLFAQEQEPKINITGKDITIEQAFGQIENQTSYSIAFNRTKFDVTKKISPALKNAGIDEALKEILKDTGFGYKINGKHIVIIENKPATKDKPGTVSVSGYVKDAGTGETLIGCYVMEPDGKTGVTTNAFGYFNMMQPPGECSIVAHYLGYADRHITMNLSRDTVLTIRLQSSQTQLNEVVVTGNSSGNKLSQPQMGVMNVTAKEIRAAPALLGETDVMRFIQLLPGIQAADERSTGISVRGGSIDQNLFLLDDAPLFQISHTGGLFSIFNDDAVKDINIYKGDIPANYGGRLSSVVDIRLKDGNMRQYNFSGNVGFLTQALAAEGPIAKERVSFYLSARHGGLGRLGGFIMPALEMGFYDINLKLNAVINDKNRLYISFYNGGDNILNFGSKFKNNTATFRWNHVYNPKLFSNVSFVYSNYTKLVYIFSFKTSEI